MQQCRQDANACPLIKGQQYQDILFRRFAGKRKEESSLKKLIKGRLSDEINMRSLVSKLEEKDIPVSCRLLWFIQSLDKTLSSYARAESCTSGYYQPIINVLKQFSSLINSLQEKLQKRLANKLKICLLNKGNMGNTTCFGMEDIDDTLFEIEKYSNQIRKHYDYFNGLLQRETDNCRGITVTSQVEQSL